MDGQMKMIGWLGDFNAIFVCNNNMWFDVCNLVVVCTYSEIYSYSPCERVFLHCQLLSPYKNQKNIPAKNTLQKSVFMLRYYDGRANKNDRVTEWL